MSGLRVWLTNSWMNSVDYLAAMAHIGWAALIVLATYALAGDRAALYMSGGLVVFASIKEFVYDANFELPKQTFRDNMQDFVGYLGGILLAWGVVLVKECL